MKHSACTRARCSGHAPEIHEMAVRLFDGEYPDIDTDAPVLDLAHELQRAWENWSGDFAANLPRCTGCNKRPVANEGDRCDLCASFARTNGGKE